MGLERLLDPNKKADPGTPKDCLECKIVGVTTLSLSGGQPTLHAWPANPPCGGKGDLGEGGREKERQLYKRKASFSTGPCVPSHRHRAPTG